jgi:hypothetical protein
LDFILFVFPRQAIEGMSDERFWSERETHAGIPPGSVEHEPATRPLVGVDSPPLIQQQKQVEEEDGPAAARALPAHAPPAPAAYLNSILLLRSATMPRRATSNDPPFNLFINSKVKYKRTQTMTACTHTTRN